MIYDDFSFETGELIKFGLTEVPSQLLDRRLPSKYRPSSALLDFSDDNENW